MLLKCACTVDRAGIDDVCRFWDGTVALQLAQRSDAGC